MKTSQAMKVKEKPARRRSLKAQADGERPTPHKWLSVEEHNAQFEAEEKSFLAQRKRLMKEHPEALYVALRHGAPVVFGQTSGDVAAEFWVSFGEQPVYIGKLSDEPNEEVIHGVIPAE
jgi:hypothetical protein